MGEEIAGACVLGWLLTLSVYDIRERRLPNWLTLPGGIAIAAAAMAAERGTPAVVGACVLFAVYLTAHLLAPAAMGAGDVKLAIGIGALTGAFGADAWLAAALGAPTLTAAVVLLRRSESTVPHGPSMCLSAAAAVALVVF